MNLLVMIKKVSNKISNEKKIKVKQKKFIGNTQEKANAYLLVKKHI